MKERQEKVKKRQLEATTSGSQAAAPAEEEEGHVRLDNQIRRTETHYNEEENPVYHNTEYNDQSGKKEAADADAAVVEGTETGKGAADVEEPVAGTDTDAPPPVAGTDTYATLQKNKAPSIYDMIAAAKIYWNMINNPS